METHSNSVVTDGQDIKAALAALTPEQFDALKQVSNYHRLARTLRSTGWLNLVLGGYVLLVGLLALSIASTFTSITLSILAFLVVLQSLWGIIRPSVRGFLGLAVVLLLCGVWNIITTLLNGFLWVEISEILLGILQCFWAYQSYESYQNYSEQQVLKPSREQTRQVNQIWESLAHPSPTLAPELIMLRLGLNRRWWRTLLLPDYALIAHTSQKMLMIVSKSDFMLVPVQPKVINREEFAIFTLIAKELMRGKIYKNSFQQYLQWKGEIEPDTPLTRLFATKRRIYTIMRWIGIALWVSFFFYCIFIMNVTSRIPR